MTENLLFFSLRIYLKSTRHYPDSNYDALLSAWLVSIEIYPNTIFISIRHFPVQTKNHSENIRAKCKTAGSYSPCQTSKMKPFTKIFKGFQLIRLYCWNYYIQRRIQNLVEYLRWTFCRNSQQLLAINKFQKKIHLRYSTGLWIRIWLKSRENNMIVKSFVFPFRISYLFLYCYAIFIHMFSLVLWTSKCRIKSY